MPFGDVFNAIFGRHGSRHGGKHHGRPHRGGYHHIPFPTGGPGYPPIGTGTGLPFPTGTFPGVPLPTESGGMNSLPWGQIPNPGIPVSRVLSIDYSLAPTVVPAVGDDGSDQYIEKRQAFGTGIVPAFPSGTGPAFPTGTVPPFPFPTGGFPTGVPSGGFPTGGFPGLPTTLATLTRGPLPTATGVPEFPDDGPEGGWWLEWIDAWKQWYEGHHKDD